MNNILNFLYVILTVWSEKKTHSNANPMRTWKTHPNQGVSNRFSIIFGHSAGNEDERRENLNAVGIFPFKARFFHQSCKEREFGWMCRFTFDIFGEKATGCQNFILFRGVRIVLSKSVIFLTITESRLPVKCGLKKP